MFLVCEQHCDVFAGAARASLDYIYRPTTQVQPKVEWHAKMVGIVCYAEGAQVENDKD